jgi:hypothetical protein
MTIKETFIVTLTGVLVAGLVFFACGALGLLLARQARAEEYRCSYVQRSYPAYDHWSGQVVTRYRYVRQCYRNHVYHYPEREPTRVYGYTRRDDDDDRGGDCKPVRRMVGQQALSVDGAKKEANEAWAAAVRFHHGEKYLDLANARRVTYSCSRSSIKEAGASITTLGQSFTRCEIEATPCRPQRDREER